MTVTNATTPQSLPYYFSVLKLANNLEVVQLFATLQGVYLEQILISRKLTQAKEHLNQAEQDYAAASKLVDLEQEIRALKVDNKRHDQESNEKIARLHATLAKYEAQSGSVEDILINTGHRLVKARNELKSLDASLQHLDVLEKETDARLVDIVGKEYRKLALRLHPERLEHPPTESDHQRFHRLLEAYQVLGDATLRKAYIQTNDHNKFVNETRMKVEEMRLEGDDAENAQPGTDNSQPSVNAKGTQPQFRMPAGLPNQCTVPLVVRAEVTDQTHGLSRLTFQWSCTNSEELGVYQYELQCEKILEDGSRRHWATFKTASSMNLTTSDLIPGEYVFKVRAHNHLGSGPWSVPGAHIIEDPMEQKSAQAKQLKLKEEAKRKSAKDALESFVIKMELDGVGKSEQVIESHLVELRNLQNSAKKVGLQSSESDLFNRVQALQKQMSDRLSHKMTLTQWKEKMSKAVKFTLAATTEDNDQSQDEFLDDVVNCLPTDVDAPVRNLIWQWVSKAVEQCPKLQIVAAPDVDVNAFLLGDDETSSNSTVDNDVPSWRQTMPHDRIRKCIEICLNRKDLFSSWNSKLSGYATKYANERKSAEEQYRKQLKHLQTLQKQQQSKKQEQEEQAKRQKAQSVTVTVNAEDSDDSDTDMRMRIPAKSLKVNDHSKNAAPLLTPPRSEASSPLPVHLESQSSKSKLSLNTSPINKESIAKAAVVANKVDSKISKGNVKEEKHTKEDKLSKDDKDKEQNHAGSGVAIACKYFLKGTCHKGDACPFAHTTSDLEGMHFWKAGKRCPRINRDGSCWYGSNCWYYSEHRLVKIDDMDKLELLGTLDEETVHEKEANHRPMEVRTTHTKVESWRRQGDKNSGNHGKEMSTIITTTTTTTVDRRTTRPETKQVSATENVRYEPKTMEERKEKAALQPNESDPIYEKNVNGTSRLSPVAPPSRPSPIAPSNTLSTTPTTSSVSPVGSAVGYTGTSAVNVGAASSPAATTLFGGFDAVTPSSSPFSDILGTGSALGGLGLSIWAPMVNPVSSSSPAPNEISETSSTVAASPARKSLPPPPGLGARSSSAVKDGLTASPNADGISMPLGASSPAAISSSEPIKLSLETVLTSLGLNKYYAMFEEQEIDLDALLLMSEEDLKELGLAMGPRLKLWKWIQQCQSHMKPREVTEPSQEQLV